MSVAVTFTVGGVDYSDYVFQADTWRESLTGIGRWEVLLDPLGNNWLGVFAVDQVMTFSIDDGAGPIRMMEGYLDTAGPYLDRRGTFTDLYKLTGRDYGLDLALLYITANYRNMRADDIVQAALIASVGEIRFGSPSIAGFRDYEFNRTFLADGIRDLAQLVNYDFYVNNTMLAIGIVAMNFFPVGDPLQHTTVNLVSDVGSLTNNILHFEMGETDGFELANRVEAIAGELNDHYTDLNAADWVGTWCTVTDELTVFLHGKGALLATNTAGVPAQPRIELGFPRYNHTVLNMSASGTGKYDYYMHDTINGIKRLRIRLRDINNNVIEFYQGNLWGLAKCYQCTDQPDNDEWRRVTFPIGEESGIEAAIGAGSNKGHWYEFNVPAGPFDWSQVTRITLTTTGVNLAFGPPADYFIVDGLEFSNVEVISIATDPTPLGGTRMLPVYRYDIKSQVELDAFSAWKLARTQDPLENIQIIAIGQTGTPYAGQSLSVRIAPYIPNLMMYRIFELHHQVVKSSDESLQPGYTFITEYNLIRHNLTAGGTQLITPERALFPVSPVKADIRKKRIQLADLSRQNLP